MTQAATASTMVTPRREGFWRSDSWRRFTRDWVGVLSALWVIFVILASIIGPFFVQDPNYADVLNRLKPPSWQNWFGTDQLGRDILARVLVGGQISIATGFISTAAAILIGMVIGTLTGYVGGAVDEVLSRGFDILITFPTLLLGIIIVVALGPSLTSVIIAISLTYVPLYGRLFRAGAMSVKNQEYVQSVVALGVPPVRIVLRHVLPNIIVPILVIAAGAMGRAVLAEASLSFLGAGVQPPTASWGNMMADGQPFLQVYPWFAMIPGTILTSITIAFCFVGDALRDAFDIRIDASKPGEATK
jgi:peptide/nickel transport system permease protein